MVTEFPRPFDDLPGEPTSLWLATTSTAGYDSLDGAIDVEVAVVGGGIAGLSTGLELAERGRSVAILERDHLAAGVTGKTTAKVTSQHGLIYDHLRREFGQEASRRYGSVNQAAIETVANRVEDWELACGFERRPAYVYSDNRDAIEREVDAAREAGLPASFVTSVPPFDRAECAIRFDDQACFHPRTYLLRVAEELSNHERASIFERTRVTDVDPGSPCRLETVGIEPAGDSGRRDRSADDDEIHGHDTHGHDTHSDDSDGTTMTGQVTADHVVLATGFPLLDRAGYFSRLTPKRSYVLALEIAGEPPDGMYYRSEDPYRSVRTHRDTEGTMVLVGGQNHKTGQGGSTAERYRRLEDWAHDRFAVRDIPYRWSTQDYVPVDRVPFIGRAGIGAENVLVATGFRGWGMTAGIAAGSLLADAIDGIQNPALELFDPLRFTPKASVSKTMTENVDAASQFATDWLQTILTPEDERIDPGEGTVIRRGSTPIALSRDGNGALHAVSAVCPHMGCLIEWNDAEYSWDCPCHGSRFSPDGDVLEGPATEDLSKREPEG